MLRLLLFGLGLASWTAVASAGTFVEFPNVSDRAPPLVGYLSRPDAGLSGLIAGPEKQADRYPAVVVLHGCAGISSRSIEIADRLGAWGYVALAIDSFGARGITNACGGGFAPHQAFDAYAALRYLGQQEFVDAARVGLLGQSWAGSQPCTRSTATWRRNISPSASAPRSRITRFA